MAFSVRPTTASDWRNVRALRLEMLADSPEAFAVSLDTARRYSSWEWRVRAGRGNTATSFTVAAIDDDGRWLGTMGAWIPALEAPPMLVSVYVVPDRRGRSAGVSDGLLDAVEQWAAARTNSLSLMVHENNSRARAFYERRGFRLTGESKPYPRNPEQRELEMVREFGAGAHRS